MTATPDAAPGDHRDVLLHHLGSVYTLAQAVTPDADRAVHLVEATYTQALVLTPTALTNQEAKLWLLQLMLQIHHEQQLFSLPDPVDTAPGAEALHAFRQRLAEHVLDQTFPAVFATLPHEQRLILLLCDVENLSSAEAGRVLGLDAETVRQRLDEARATCERTLRAEASSHERHLLDTNLSTDWLSTSLHRLVESAFHPVPPTLRPTILESFQVQHATPDQPTAPAASRLATPQPAVEPPSVAARPRQGLRRAVVAVIMILTVGLVGYLGSRSLERTPETNLLTLSAQQTEEVRPSFPTSSPEQAEEFVRGRLGWRLTLPTIDHAALTGVGVHELAPGVTVPVFLYEDTSEDGGTGQSITLYVFNYALLDRHKDRVQLSTDILRQIQDDQRFDLYDLGEHSQVLIWRNRDDIYLAVTPGDAELLRQRIVFPS